MARRSFTPEFKSEAAKLVLEQGRSVAQTCKALGIGETALRRWMAQWQAERQGLPPSGGALTPEQRRIQELEAKVAQLERERDILKKSTAFFVKELERSTK